MVGIMLLTTRCNRASTPAFDILCEAAHSKISSATRAALCEASVSMRPAIVAPIVLGLSATVTPAAERISTFSEALSRVGEVHSFGTAFRTFPVSDTGASTSNHVLTWLKTVETVARSL